VVVGRLFYTVAYFGEGKKRGKKRSCVTVL